MKRLLSSRLDRHFGAMSALIAAAAVGGAVRTAEAGIVYSGVVNINIPTTLFGVYLNVVTGATGTTAPTGWDVNLWGTSAMRFIAGTNAGFVMAGTSVANLPPGTTIGGASTFGTGALDPATAALNSQNNLIGFKFQNEATGNQIHYGWLRISLSSDQITQPRTCVEFAYEDTPGATIDAGVSVGDPNAGACCKPDGTCVSNLVADCTALGGSWTSAGTTCSSAGCASRCCKPDGTCALLTSAACTGAGGIFTTNTTCAAACPQPGACCTADGLSCSVTLAPACTAAGNLFRGEGTVCGTCGVPFAEAEPNEDRVTATAVNFVNAGDYIRGNTTGAVSTAGATSFDQFLVKTPARAPGVYRNRLEITTPGTAGHTGTIRGLTVTAAVAGPWPGPVGTPTTTDATLQTSVTSPSRFNQWYGFGKQEQIYYRVSGAAATTGDYLSLWTVSPVTPTNAGNFQPGQIDISTVGQAHSTDIDFWVYDSNFDAIDGFGNDGASTNGGAASATNTAGFLRRTYPAGTYYVATSAYNLANNKGSPCDDNWRTGTVLDFPNALSTSSTSSNSNLAFSITDSAGTVQVAAAMSGPFEVAWVKFTVGGGGGSTCYANCDSSTQNPFLNVQDFTCFLTKFSGGAAYANCDGSTQAPVLNVQDFTCFLQKFAAGCSAP